MTIRSDYQRARSATEKADRRERILEAADTLARTSGIDTLTMNALAKAAGVAKGTLYLYFETKEEVLLTLFVEANKRFTIRLGDAITPELSDAEFCTLYWRTLASDPQLSLYNAQLGSLIERNVSSQALITAKREMRTLMGEPLEQIEDALSLSPGQGAVLLIAFANLAAGANQSDIAPYVDLEALPHDVSEMIEGFRAETLFQRNAALVFKGLRAGT